MTRPVAQMTIRQLTAADRGAALDVVNTAARWYGEFLPAAELHNPEMTAAQWDEEARLARIMCEKLPTLTPALSLTEGEGALPIPSPPEGERDRVRGRAGRGRRVHE